MVDVLIALLPILLIIVSGIIKERYSSEGKKEKKQKELDEAFAEKDIDFIAVELEYYHRMLKEKNGNTTEQQKDN
jgi:hypothetical protein